MTTEILEREGPLATIADVIGSVQAGEGGRLVLVSGEAGSGKTSLVRTLAESVSPAVEVLVGRCDNLRTPRPAAPLLDWLLDRGASAPAQRQDIFPVALEMLGGPVVAVIEDAHWADEATLDLLLFLGRRVRDTSAVLLVTYRPEEAVPPHPLSAVLGELATTSAVRVPVEPLSIGAVTRLARGTDVDPIELHRRTEGNAFFVTECLSSGGGVPDTLRGAVLARASRLSRAGRRALDVASVAPARIELWLADVLGAPLEGVDECVATGLLVTEGDAVRFRHELAREAIHAALPLGDRRELHARAAGALIDSSSDEVDHARVVHHAVEAGADDVALRHAPRAAAAAAAVGARREAVAQLEVAVARSGRLTPNERRELWARLAQERATLGDHDAAIVAYERALDLAVQVGDDRARGELLARMWAPLSMAGRLDRAGEAAATATELLEAAPPGPALALARAQHCAQHMLARELSEAEPWGQAAIGLAEEVDAPDILAYALIQSGVALWMAGSAEGLDRLRRGVRIAEEHGSTALVAQGLSQIGSGGGEVRHYGDAVPALEACIAHAEAHELGSRGIYAQAWLARCHLELGRWDEASQVLATVLQSPRCDGISRITALTALGRLRARRGDPDVWLALDEAWRLAATTGHLQRTWPVAVARAEAASFDGRLGEELRVLERIFESAVHLGHRWAVGETGFWLWRAGVPVQMERAAVPFALHVAGDLHGAAREWEALGCPYERASALADSEEDDDQLTALEIYRGLGARPSADRLIGQRRAARRSVPRGPNAATRSNPAGLSNREVDVLRLVAEGCTNREIAERLHLSPKTVGHHVSHTLTKLGARSRAEAVAAAAERGILLTRTAPSER